MACVIRRALGSILALALVAPLSLLAQPSGTAAPFKPEELEQIAAPIALYPDPLLAQVLMAATYPLEAVMAARMLQAYPNLKGESLDAMLRAQNWDDSVKALTRVPQILAMMNDKLEWTQKLGDAVLAQRQDLMDAIQRLRARAQSQGTLVTTPQQVVTTEAGPPPFVDIEPATPDLVYVPIYNPLFAFGPWPYPLYLPYDYYPPGWVYSGAFFSFGVGVAVGVALWGICDWHRREIGLDRDRYRGFSRTVNVQARRDLLEAGRPASPGQGRLEWEHSPEHRRGVQYRDAATGQRFGRPASAGAAARETFRGRIESGAPPVGRAPRGAPTPTPPQEPGAFQGLGRGPDVRGYSTRGRESRQGTRPTPAPAPRGGAAQGMPRGGGSPGGGGHHR